MQQLNPSGQRSSVSSSRGSALRRGLTPAGQSQPGSTTTTPSGCTPRSATCLRSSGNYASPVVNFKPHNHVSGCRGEGHTYRESLSSDGTPAVQLTISSNATGIRSGQKIHFIKEGKRK